MHAASRAPPVLGERAEVGVVVHHDRNAVALAQVVEAALSLPFGKHDLGEREGMLGIHRARHGDADADQRARGVAAALQRRVAERVHEFARAGRIGAHRVMLVLPVEHLPAQVGHRDRHVGGADFDAEDAAGAVLEVEHDRPPSTERLARTALAHEAGGEQRVHDFGHGGAGQIGTPRDFGARNRALLPDQAQDRVGQRPRAHRFGSGRGATGAGGFGGKARLARRHGTLRASTCGSRCCRDTRCRRRPR